MNDKISVLLGKVDPQGPGLSLLVRHNDQVQGQYHRGLANKIEQLGINNHTGFRLGSIAKPFTAIAVMQLIEKGSLSLDDAVTTYLPTLGAKWQKISIRQLLSHRVSLSRDFFSDANLALANGADNRALLAFITSSRVQVKPREQDEAIYCNSCYVLLAEIVAAASGESFATYMRRHIFAPAGMVDSYLVEKGTKLSADAALNFGKSPRFFGIEQYTTGAMAQISSLEDLNKFIIALKQGALISRETLKLMTQVHADMGNDGLYGLGWEIGYGDEPFFAHGGSQDGYQTQLFFYPKYNLEIVALANNGDSGYELTQELIHTIVMHYKNGSGNKATQRE
ncbi:beta-lactamase family protein [Shewanella sedimentimangrovi]|uniref:Beta-lactamase family protein n=1 Tax=Shewanella sedimentimangrovi TaxID=2814293 RepID=A0ABX7QYY9_9GAMM|nr:beta-lactamase family protein [Shewanella sedimentimangrovi]